MIRELEVELPTIKLAAQPPPRRIRPAPKILFNAPSAESAAKTPRGINHILTPLQKSGFWNKVKSRRRTQRKEAVAKLTELASTKRIAPGDLTDLCPTLKKLITDRSVSVRVEAVRAIGNLARELGSNFSRCVLILLPVLLANFGEKNHTITEALTKTLEAIHKAGCVTLTNILTDVNTAVKSEDPNVCSRTLNWVMYCIDSSTRADILYVYKNYIRICLECLNYGTAQVKDAALSIFVTLGKLADMGPFDDIMCTKFSEMKQGMKQGWKRWRIAEANMARGMKADAPGQNKLVEHKDVEPSEMTQLENAAWKQPREDVITAVKSEDPLVCSETLNWVMYWVDSSNTADILNVHKDCLECLNDGTAQVKDAAYSILVAIEKSIGMGALNKPLDSFDDLRRESFSEMIGVSGRGTPTVPRHGIMKQGLKRGRIAEPSEMTQLKNAAWKKPREEIDQLEKVSLTDPEELNKKDVDSEDEFNRLEKVSLTDPEEVNKMDVDSEDDYSLDDLLSCREWDKENCCSTCGSFEHYCMCKLTSSELYGRPFWERSNYCTRCLVLDDYCLCLHPKYPCSNFNEPADYQ